MPDQALFWYCEKSGGVLETPLRLNTDATWHFQAKAES